MEVKEVAKLNTELEVYNYPGEYQDPGPAGHRASRSQARLEAHQAHRRSGSGPATARA
jgi:uncharacterized protein involved in type VI secretion and phage assembly